ncbi:hypothetical protein RhiirA5_417159 [Rhizophagus irregularis]|uniref:Uncharacterized protein n=1 Tax=Rhizophagus irregularis TaxID=588596 RepID=A0A2I1ERB9_9GLOM|nr:hypothetical protein RhiirA5_417159 [Rhizophagus irregularis]PKY24680.1 hypothetical protein RhiirB3_439330 [Rhizophagus irregularis]
MKKCWDSDPLKRPTIDELTSNWFYSGIPLNDPVDSADLIEIINQAEKMRLELIRSKKLGPESIEKTHPKAVFTSRALSSFVSKPLTLNFSSRNSFNLKQEYITKEYVFDINNIESSSTNNISSVQNSFNSRRQNAFNSLEYITKEYEFDINNIKSSSTSNISSVQSSFNSRRQNSYISKPFSKLVTTITANSSRKHNIEELNIETQNNRKHTKTDNSD